MKHVSSFAIGVALSAFVATTFVMAETGPLPAGQQSPGGTTAPDDASVALFTRTCIKCHDAARITGVRRSRMDWEEVITKMIEKGATGTEKEFEGVYEYLVRNFGKIYINHAVADEITTILGLSSKDAEAIIAYRKANGAFADFDAIKKVPDIDVKKLEDLREAVAF